MIKEDNSLYGYNPLPDKIPDKPDISGLFMSLVMIGFAPLFGILFWQMVGFWSLLFDFIMLSVTLYVSGILPYVIYKMKYKVKIRSIKC